MLAVPKLDVSEVATNAKTFVALAVAPELTFSMSEVVKSDIVSVPKSTLKVSAPAPPESEWRGALEHRRGSWLPGLGPDPHGGSWP